jgi:hypothetical protein
VDGLRTANLGLRFVLELAALIALAAWGFHTGDSWAADIALGIGAPVLAAVAWGLFVAPKARFVVPVAMRIAVELLVFGAAVVALWAAGWHTASLVLGIAVAVSELLLYGLGDPQQRRA